MSIPQPDYLESPFVIVTDRLIIVPTPIAVQFPTYVQMYGSLHASEAFCQMAFGPHFLPVHLDEQGTRNMIVTRDLERCWQPRGLGDFAVGLRVRDDGLEIVPGDMGSELKGEHAVRIVETIDGGGLSMSIGGLSSRVLDQVRWVGYAGVRDATTTSMPDRIAGDEPLPPWQEMVELRYGVHGEFWGKGLAGEAARAVMQWATERRGVRRFIAETEKTNTRSGKVLRKMGFNESGTNYWKEPSEMEWERIVV